MITIFNIALTIGVYNLSRVISKRFSSPITTPVFLSTVLVITILLLLNITYTDYKPALQIMTLLLGPATVALAVPLYKNRNLFSLYFTPAFWGLITGTFATVFSAVLMAKLLHLGRVVMVSLSIKSITVPVAIEVAKTISGSIPMSAAFVIITGMFGAMFGPFILTIMKVDHPFARGLSIGTISHGIGTAAAFKEGEMQGAVAGAAMCLSAVLTSCTIPYILPFFI